MNQKYILVILCIVVVIILILYNTYYKKEGFNSNEITNDNDLICEDLPDGDLLKKKCTQKQYSLIWNNFGENKINLKQPKISIWEPKYETNSNYNKFLGYTYNNKYEQPTKKAELLGDIYGMDNNINMNLLENMDKSLKFEKKFAIGKNREEFNIDLSKYVDFIKGDNYLKELITFNDNINELEQYYIKENFNILTEEKYKKLQDIIKRLTYIVDVNDKILDVIKTGEKWWLNKDTKFKSMFDKLRNKFNKDIDGTFTNKQIVFYKSEKLINDILTYDIETLKNNSLKIPDNYKNNVIKSIKLPIGVKLTLNDTHSFYIPYKYKNIDNKNVIWNKTKNNKLYLYDTTIDNGNYYINNINDYKNKDDKIDYIYKISIEIPQETKDYLFNELTQKFNSSVEIIQDKVGSIKEMLKNMKLLDTSITNKTYTLPNLSCWKVILPDREMGENEFIATGDIISSEINDKSEINVTKAKKHIACIPIHCYRKVRNWLVSDIIYETTKGGKYYALFYNPYTNSIFGATSKKGPEKPHNFVGKIVACPERKSIIVEDIIDTDRVARRRCNANKRIKDSVPIVPRDSDYQEEKLMQEKIYNQTRKIEALKKQAHRINIENNKADIINKEYNRNRLQNYVENQRELIDKTLKKLEDGRQKININLKYPVKVIDDIMDCIVSGTCVNISHDDKLKVLNKLSLVKDNIQYGISKGDTSYINTYKSDIADALEDCPQFDLSGFIKKDPPCFGCTNLDY